MKYAKKLATLEEHGYDAINLPKGIDPACWMVLASWMLSTNQAGTIAHNTFTPRKLVMDHIDKFEIGKHSVTVGDWCALL